MAKQYVARAIAGDQVSSTFYINQQDNGPKLDRYVGLVVKDLAKLSNKGERQCSTTNRELGLYKSHNTAWLNETLKGFRVKHGDQVQIRVEILSMDLLSEDEFNKAEKF